MAQVTLKVLLFATYRDQTGQRELALAVPEGSRVSEVAAQLERDFSELRLQGALAAINEDYAAPDAVLQTGDTLAFFPPVAGGSGGATGEDARQEDRRQRETKAETAAGLDHLFVTSGVLELAHLHALATSPQYGAVASFVGTVRSPNFDKDVLHIDYEGYEKMILTQMKRAAGELRERFSLGHIVFAHRLGRLQPGEASIVIVTSSAHRKDALYAVHAGIDRLKELLPVWKLEVTSEGQTWVEGSSAAAKTL